MNRGCIKCDHLQRVQAIAHSLFRHAECSCHVTDNTLYHTVLGSRIVEVHNSSSLSTGKAGSGPSNLRQYIIEQDMLEAIVALPEEMFYNTPITTYIWVLTNKKDVKRKGKVQLIDATKIKTSLRKNLGNKKFEISKELRSKILDIYMGFDQADSKLSKIVDNSDFGYWEVPIMHPLYDENGKIVVETKGKNKGKPKADKDLTDMISIGTTGTFHVPPKCVTIIFT